MSVFYPMIGYLYEGHSQNLAGELSAHVNIRNHIVSFAGHCQIHSSNDQ